MIVCSPGEHGRVHSGTIGPMLIFNPSRRPSHCHTINFVRITLQANPREVYNGYRTCTIHEECSQGPMQARLSMFQDHIPADGQPN